MSTAAKIGPPKMRFATLDDYERIAQLEASQGLGTMPAADWRNLWVNNPLWPRLHDRWPVGWLFEDAAGRLVGSLVNIPSFYTFRGRELICANGRGWVSTPEYRGYSLQLMSEYFDQPGADLFMNSTVALNAAPVLSALSQRVPLGDFQSSAFWITSYRGFAKKVLRKLFGPTAALLGHPAALGLWVKDQVSAKSLPAPSKSVTVEFADGFDSGFDAFWKELVQHNTDKLLAFRDRPSLAWHFGYHRRVGRLWIMTAARTGLLRAYGIFRRHDGADEISRMQLVDYQTLEPEEDLLPGLLQVALQRCATENLFALEQVGCGIPKRRSFDNYAPHRHRFECWRFYFQAADPAIRAELSRPEVWDPSIFDGDASFD